MKIEKIGESKIIMKNTGKFSPGGQFNYFGWPTVARLKNGVIAVAASGFRVAHICPFGKTVMSFSDDEGENFTDPMPVIDTVLDDRDGGLCTFGESGLIITAFNNTVEFQRNRCRKLPACYAYLDTVKKEDEEKAIGSEFRISFDNGKTFGEIFRSPITSPHGPVELHDGRIVWVGRVFSDNDAFDKGAPYIRACEIDVKTGKMFEIGQIDDVFEDGEPLEFCEPHAIELPDGKLICHIRENKHFSIWQSESTDGGRSWTKAHPILGERGGSPAHLFLHSSGTLISAYGNRTEPFDVKVMFSEDGGESWDSGYNISNVYPTLDLGYPATVELQDGSLLTVFYAPIGSEGPSVIWSQRWKFTK